ncbi:DUF3822 family protein [Puia dinghuensis]|uniref:DUF3822 family protein n=1 Tax=Puia dinghuensis TaxID=1792502 RepID=A0A8J2XPU3_9BACT|nr:DUF3822 family protein [Puia dinghuensis]GGA82626.1 hypothetical protein GCM10011511_02010 [Puia dinghuensis]
MLKPAFQIEVSDISAEEMLQSRLLVEVTPNAFTYVLLNQRNMSPLVVKYFQLEPTRDIPLTGTLRELMEGDSLLQRPVKETLLVYNFPESSLIPEPVFTMDTNREIIDTLHGNLQKGLILTEKIPWWELFNVYRIQPELHHLLQQTFTAGKYWHYYSLLLKSFKMFDSTEREDCIKVIFYSDKMVALVVREGKVHLVQTFLYRDSKDVAYHLLNCCHQLGLDQESVRLLVGGLIDRQSSLSEELHKYFLRIQFDEIDESIKVTDELKELPLHYFSSILKMAVCA